MELSESVNTVQSKSGFTTGAYDISCYALVYLNTHNQHGKITTETKSSLTPPSS